MAALVIGCVLSAVEILHDVHLSTRLQPGVAARVNGVSIDTDSVNRTVAGLDARARADVSSARKDVVSRMIDEELLVQHALATGAAQTSPEVRAALVRSAITRVNEEAAAAPLSDRELTDYFSSHREAYATPARFEVTPFYFQSRSSPGAETALARANAAREALRNGQSPEQVAATADAFPFQAPRQPITAHTLSNYFGPQLATAVQHLAVGQTSSIEPLGAGAAFFLLRRREGGEIPELAAVRELVAADAMRDRQERALQGLLAELRQSAHIDLSSPPPGHDPVKSRMTRDSALIVGQDARFHGDPRATASR